MLPFLILSLVVAQTAALGPGNHERTLDVGGMKRTYLVHVPKGQDRKRPWPVVLSFHGGGSNSSQWAGFCGLDEKADRAGFIAVYPNGTGKKFEDFDAYEVLTWNGGPRQPGGEDAVPTRVDDVAFIRALLDDLAKVVEVDEKRVYATGMSLGAIMVYRLASELSDRFAAIAPVCGPMATATCHPSRPVPVIHFHGSDDHAVPFKGGKGRLDVSETDFYSAEHSIRAWVKANGCGEKPTIEALPDKVKDGTRVTRKTYGGGREGSEVVLIVIEGGGHTWPGREYGPELEILGRSTRDVSANDLIWAFFEKHPMK